MNQLCNILQFNVSSDIANSILLKVMQGYCANWNERD